MQYTIVDAEKSMESFENFGLKNITKALAAFVQDAAGDQAPLEIKYFLPDSFIAQKLAIADAEPIRDDNESATLSAVYVRGEYLGVNAALRSSAAEKSILLALRAALEDRNCNGFKIRYSQIEGFTRNQLNMELLRQFNERISEVL